MSSNSAVVAAWCMAGAPWLAGGVTTWGCDMVFRECDHLVCDCDW